MSSLVGGHGIALSCGGGGRRGGIGEVVPVLAAGRSLAQVDLHVPGDKGGLVPRRLDDLASGAHEGELSCQLRVGLEARSLGSLLRRIELRIRLDPRLLRQTCW